MRALSLAIAFLCSAGIAFSAKPLAGKFERYQFLSRYTPLDLDDSTYEDLTSKPRDYHVAVLLTALEARYGCTLCRDFQPEWELIARSWNKGSKPDGIKMLFGTLDFNRGKNTFQKVSSYMLLISGHPLTNGEAYASNCSNCSPLPADRRSFCQSGWAASQIRLQRVRERIFQLNSFAMVLTSVRLSPISADQLYMWINRHLPEGVKPPLVRPVNYMRLISVVTILMGVVTLFNVLSSYVLPIIRNRNVWAAVSLIAILLFTSGHMFNHIRKVPYVAGDGKGGISYFAGGFSNQFGMETQIIAATCE